MYRAKTATMVYPYKFRYWGIVMSLSQAIPRFFYFIYKAKGRMNMREFLRTSGIAPIIVASIILVAFLPKNVSQWIVLVIVGVWAITNTVLFCNRHKEFFKSKSFKRISKSPNRDKNGSDSPLDFKYSKIQLGHRITDRLQSAYPNSTWNWKDKPTASLFINGGSVRITTANTETYNEAEVVVDCIGRIEINMLAVSCINDIIKKQYKDAETEYIVDVKMWYEQCAASYLTELITDLNSKGTKTLTIDEKGCIKLDDNKEVGMLNRFPAKNLWKQLISILESEELKAVEIENCIQIGW